MWLSRIWHRMRYDGTPITRRVAQDHGTKGNDTRMTDTQELNHYTQERLELERRTELNHLREKYRSIYPEDDELILPERESTHMEDWDRRREEDYCWEYEWESCMDIDEQFEMLDRDDDEYDRAPVWEQGFWDAIQDGTIDEYLEAYY